MKLYVCYGTWKRSPGRSGGDHPCGLAFNALKDAGYSPEVIKSYGLGILPDLFNRTAGRKEVRRLTDKNSVPVLVTDDDEVITDSHAIKAWAEKHPANPS